MTLVCACAATGRPTPELYSQINAIRLYGFMCHGGPPRELEARMTRLLPWLATALGTETVASMEEELVQDATLVDPVRCPSAAERDRARVAYARRLGALERRSRPQ
jgi:hypothetical protein